MPKITFDNRNNLFFQSLKLSVDDYFESNHLKKTGNWRLFIKTVILLSTALTIYLVLMFLHPNNGIALLLAALLGYNLACIGFCIMHDANHGSYCTRNLLNDGLGLSMNALGASAFFWKQKHNILHHTYTNIDGLDDDIAKSPVIRQCDSQRWIPAHKIQHLYLLPIYAVSTIFWVFIMDFAKYFTGRIYTTAAWKMTFVNHLVFWLTKVLYLVFYMVLPAMVWGIGHWAIGFLVMNAVLGLTLSLVFQLAHVVEITEFESVALDETKHIETAWAEHELKTTANFAMGNSVISWFVGGLNFQIEHHLFPKVSHIHYPAISKIVMAKCKEFNLPYNKFDTLRQAVNSHFRMMKKLGKNPSGIKINPQVQAV